MAGRLSIYFGWVHEVAGRVYDFMNPRAVENEVTTTGDRAGNEQFLTVEAEDTLAVYSWTTDGDFEAFAVQIRGEGYLTAEIVTDTPTSAQNLAASGLNAATYRLDISNHCPFVLGSDQIWDNALGANRKIYSITLRNRDDEDDVTVVVGHVN